MMVADLAEADADLWNATSGRVGPTLRDALRGMQPEPEPFVVLMSHSSAEERDNIIPNYRDHSR